MDPTKKTLNNKPGVVFILCSLCESSDITELLNIYCAFVFQNYNTGGVLNERRMCYHCYCLWILDYVFQIMIVNLILLVPGVNVSVSHGVI